MTTFLATTRAKHQNKFSRRAQISLLTLSFLLSACSGGGGSSSTAQPVASPPPPPPPPVGTNLDSETNVIYGTGLTQNSSVNLELDIYQPEGDCSQRRPFVLGIHGGGFTGGSKSDSSWVSNMEAVVARGYAGLSIDYRLVGDQPVISAEFQPVLDDLDAEADRLNLTADQRAVLNASVAAFEDTVAALDWVRENADARCLDIDNFALWGSSAGAITGLHVGHALDDYFIDRPEPKVVIDYWGRLFLEGQVDATDPPFMIIHGTADSSQIYAQTALVLAAEADAVGLAYSFYTIQDGPHGFGAVNPNRIQINGQSPLEVTLDFIEAHLLDQPAVYEVQTIIPQ